MTREPCVAGKFYEEDFQKLEVQIKDCFYSDLGPGDLPIKRSNEKIRAVIVPHAGYDYSGPCATWAYKIIGESKFSDTYILIGPNHHDNVSSISFEDWKTPFGIVKTNKDLARKISEETGLKIGTTLQKDEHSNEVQLPFLQFVSKDRLKDLKIVSIMLSKDIKITEFANNLRKSIADETLIVSSDFTHYGRSYGYIPFEIDAQKNIKDMDLKSINFIKNNDLPGFIDYLEETQSTICGKIPIIVLMQTLKDYNASLEMFYTSTEISKDIKNSVSYASVIFK